MAPPRSDDRLELIDQIQVGSFVVSCTAVLIAVCIGIGAVVDGVAGFDERVPFYVLTMAITFAGSLVAFEAEVDESLLCLPWAVGVGIGAFALVSLAGEGTAYVVEYPNSLVLAEIAFYVLAGVLAGSGVGYWVLRNWETLSPSRPGL